MKLNDFFVLQLFQNRYLPKGPLRISRMLKCIKDFFECYNRSRPLIFGLPNMAISPRSQFVYNLVSLQDVRLYFLLIFHSLNLIIYTKLRTIRKSLLIFALQNRKIYTINYNNSPPFYLFLHKNLLLIDQICAYKQVICIILYKMIFKKEAKVVEKLIAHLFKAKFSTHSPSLGIHEQLAEEAQMAMHYINEICKSNEKKPLVERLIDLKVDNVDRGVFEKKRRLFVGGVPIDTVVFNQQRVLTGIGQKTNLFCFYPTSMVTQPIFNHFNEFNIKKSMVFGPYGISKTTSIILYHQLSSDVNKYLYLASDQKRQQFRTRWTEKGAQIPNKLFYWSIRLGQPQERTVEILQRQCHELNLSVSTVKLSQIVYEIYKYYNAKKMPCNVIIDQINKVASVFRDYNKYILNKESHTKEILKQKEKAIQAKQYFDQINNIAKWTEGNYFFNSADDIQDSVLGVPKLYNLKNESQLLFLNLNDHSKIDKFRIQYIENMRKEVGQKEIDLIIAKQVINRLPLGTVAKLWGLSAEQMEEAILKDEITAIRGMDQWQFFIRPLTIHYTARNYTFFTKFLESKKMLMDEIGKMVKLLKSSSRIELIQKMLIFLTKGERCQSKQALASHIYFMALDLLKETQPHETNFIIKKQQLQKFDPMVELDQELFIQQNDYYLIQVSPYEYTEVFKENELSLILNSQKLRLAEYYIKNEQYRQTFGNLVQLSFVSYLRNSFKNVKLKVFQNNFSFISIKNFVHLNARSEKYQTVLSHFSDMIEACRKNNQAFIIGLPTTADNKSSGVSHSIDILFMRISDQIMTIYSFDFATSNNIENIKTKLKKKKVADILLQARKQIQKEMKGGHVIPLEPQQQSQKIQKKKTKKIQIDKESEKTPPSPPSQEEKKKLPLLKKWGVKHLEWDHMIVVSPEVEDKLKEIQQLQKKQQIPSDFLYDWITFEDLQISEGDNSVDRQVYQKAVRLMTKARRWGVNK